MPKQPETTTLPLVPLRDMVVFPSMMAPFVVGRRASILALEATLSTSEKKIFLATQKDPKIDDPAIGEIYPIGVIARVRPSTITFTFWFGSLRFWTTVAMTPIG